MLRKSCLILTGIALAAVLACETNQKRATAPGAMPKSQDGPSPRLSASTYVAHGELLERRGELERAALQYRKALELTPDLPSARNRLGITLNKLGRHAEASVEFREALARHPDQPYLCNNLGFSLYLERQYEDAELFLARAVELQPAFRRARMNHGLVLARLGRYEEALAEFSQAGTEADAHYNVAVIQAEAGQYALAARSLEQALRCDPDMTAAQDQLRQISRLAAAQEAAAIAAAEAEAARLAPPAAAGQAKLTADLNVATPLPSVPASSGTEDIVITDIRAEAPAGEAVRAGAQPVEPEPSLEPDAADIPDSRRLARIYQRITTLLAIQERPFSSTTIWWTPGALEPSLLRQMLCDLIAGAASGAPWYESRVSQCEELLGLAIETP